jgi:hypothetical protein
MDLDLTGINSWILQMRERERGEKEEEKPVGLQRGTCRFPTNEEEDGTGMVLCF